MSEESAVILFWSFQAIWSYRPFNCFNLVWFVPWRNSLIVLDRVLVSLLISRVLEV